MKKVESLEEIKRWFLREVEKLWPIAGGSLSLRKNRCIRRGCQACQSGEGHPSYALHYHYRGRQSSIYVPDDLSEDVKGAVLRGRKLQELIVEAGRRYVRAIKAQRHSSQGGG